VLVLDDFSSSFASDFLRFDSSSDDLSSSFDVFVSDLVVSFSSDFLLAESDSSVSQPRLRRPAAAAASDFFSKNEKQ
jgi:hypothetical protein